MGLGLVLTVPTFFPNLTYRCYRDYDMLDASFTLLHNTNQKMGFLDLFRGSVLN
jgi:hypothetical protein